MARKLRSERPRPSPVSSTNAVGVAPLVTGLLLAGQSVGGLPSPESVAGMVGGGAAALVGLGLLAGWRDFEAEPGSSGAGLPLVLSAVALAGFVGGVALAVA
jgi:hypothetical protein